MRAVEAQVKIVIYSSFAVVGFVSLTAALVMLHLLRWMPFTLSVYVVTVMFFTSTAMFALQRQAEADRLGPAS
jgi:pyridoxal/pyridoxine/pyridoxamine kinase